jgi:hypothetical protein
MTVKHLQAISLCIGLSFGPIAHVSAQDASYWNVKPEQFSCLQKNLSVYQGVTTHRVIIFLEECPEIDIAKIIRGRTKNSSLPGVEKVDKDATKFTEVISFDHGQLACLKALNLKVMNNLVKVPQDPCK